MIEVIVVINKMLKFEVGCHPFLFGKLRANLNEYPKKIAKEFNSKNSRYE